MTDTTDNYSTWSLNFTVCDTCGANVGDRNAHTIWHTQLERIENELWRAVLDLQRKIIDIDIDIQSARTDNLETKLSDLTEFTHIVSSRAEEAINRTYDLERRLP